MEESNCCGACRLWETDICSYCKENAEFASIEEWQRKEEVMNYRNSVMDKIIDVWNSFKVIKR